MSALDARWEPWDPVHSPNTCSGCGYSGVVHDEYLDGEDASYVCPDCDALSDAPQQHRCHSKHHGRHHGELAVVHLEQDWLG